MRTWLQLSFLAAASSALLLVGCGDDAVNVRLGSEGDSCVRTGDCSNGLSCINSFCAVSGGASGSGGSDVDGGAGTGGGSTGPALGGEGETCQARRDCSTGLQCIEQRCTSGGAAGSGGAPAPRLGARGESCLTVSDCSEGLTCILRGFGGVCDLQNYGLEPTGNVCTGECSAKEDCCELPPNLIPGIVSCEALVASTQVAGGLDNNTAANCPVTGPTMGGGYETACFYYRTYCVCGANTWACERNQCEYKASCEPGYTATWDGCPRVTRNGTVATATTCNSDEKCELTPACQTPSDCATASDTGASCAGDGCACFENTCYLKCDEDLDCRFGFECDTTDDVCKPSPACTTDQQCAISLRDATAECNEGTCVIPCTTDQDCSDSGALGVGTPFNAMVCNADNFCESLGCTSDADCMLGGVHMFCVAPSAPLGSGAASAITD